MKITELCLKRPVTTFMVFTSFIVIGFIAFRLLPMEYFPAVDAPFLVVNIPYPGSTPEEVEREITRPVEEALAMIGGIKKMESYSMESQSEVVLIFDWGVNINIKSLEAREKIDGIRHLLPDDMERYYVHKWRTQDMPILELRLSTDRDLSSSHDMLDRNVKRRLERIEGISQANLYGVEKKQIEILLNMDKIITHRIDIGYLLEKLRKSDFSLTAGKIYDGRKRLLVRPIGELKSISEIENLIVGKNNIRLKDIALISYDTPELDYGRHLDRKYAIGVEVLKSSGANTIEVSDRVIEEIEEIKKLPEMEGINIYFMDNLAEGITSSLNELFKSGVLGAFLATLVLLFFLRKISTTLIVVISIPFSILVTGTFMHFMGITLNILSMMGLLLAVGMLVDNAVVAMESIHRYEEIEKDKRQAVIRGTNNIAMAITAGTLTTIIVFLPNIIGAKIQVTVWLKHVGITLVIALIASLIIAQTIVPLLAYYAKHNGKKEQKRNIVDKLTDFYSRILLWEIDHHKTSVFIMLLVLFSIALPMFPPGRIHKK